MQDTRQNKMNENIEEKNFKNEEMSVDNYENAITERINDRVSLMEEMNQLTVPFKNEIEIYKNAIKELMQSDSKEAIIHKDIKIMGQKIRISLNKANNQYTDYIVNNEDGTEETKEIIFLQWLKNRISL